MKCPRCGASNKAENTACFRCGAALAPVSEQPKAAASITADKLWYPPGEREARQRPDKKKPQPDPSLVALDDDAPSQEYGEKHRTNIDKLSSFRDGENVTIVLPPEPEPEPDPFIRMRRKRRARQVLSVLLLLVLLGGAGYGGVRLVRSITTAYRNWRESRIAASLPPEPLVERVLQDGEVWHKITFYGQDGERVLIEDPRESKAIREGKAEFFLSDEYFVSKNTDSEETVITVTLNATLFSATGEETAITVPSYTIDIPESPLKIILPEQQNYQTDENRILIKIKVTPGSRVLIKDNNAADYNNVSDYVDSEGYLSTTEKVYPIGTNTIKIMVETEGHRQTIYDLMVDRPELAVDFELTDEPPSSTKDSSIVIEGTTEVGATITTDAKIKGGSTDVDAAGKFEFTVNFSRYGENLIHLSIKATDGRTSDITYRIDRIPDITSYTKSAWVMDYPYLSTSPMALIGKIFECKGVVIKKMEDETSNYFLYDVGTDSTQAIVLEYNGSTVLEEGKEYTIFADVIGTYKEYPLLAARFIKLE